MRLRLLEGSRRSLVGALAVVSLIALSTSVVAALKRDVAAEPVDPGALWCLGWDQVEIATIPREKLAALARECKDFEAGQANPAQVPEGPQPPSPEPPPPWPEGLFGPDDADDFPAPEVRFVSAWSKVIDGRYVTVRVGWAQDPATGEEYHSQGKLLVHTIEPSTWEQSFKWFAPPIPGPLYIGSASGVRLTIVNAAGRRVVFDAAKGRFLAA